MLLNSTSSEFLSETAFHATWLHSLGLCWSEERVDFDSSDCYLNFTGRGLSFKAEVDLIKLKR